VILKFDFFLELAGKEKISGFGAVFVKNFRDEKIDLKIY